MSGFMEPEYHDRLTEMARQVWADDPRFAAGLVRLRPCPPREYRRRRVWRGVGLAACVLGCLILVMWAVLGWIAAALVTLNAAAAVPFTGAGDLHSNGTSVCVPGRVSRLTDALNCSERLPRLHSMPPQPVVDLASRPDLWTSGSLVAGGLFAVPCAAAGDMRDGGCVQQVGGVVTERMWRRGDDRR